MGRGIYFLPGMWGQIKQLIEKCEACQKFRPSQPPEPLLHTQASYPMENVSADLFQANGADYIVVVDWYSGNPFVEELRKTTTATVLQALERWFRIYGYPQCIRTDGGPQFRSEFAQYCREHGIHKEQSSPYHLESNGHAEAAVKNVKYHLLKVGKLEFPAALAQWKNTATSAQPSPNELFFKCHLRLNLPVTTSYLESQTDMSAIAEPQAHESANARELRPFNEGYSCLGPRPSFKEVDNQG